MNRADLVSALESRLVNAWPSPEVELCDGWLLRFARGYSKRANSASAVVPGAGLDDGLLSHIVARFREEGLRPTFRLTGLEAAAADRFLAERGFDEVEPTLALVRPIAEVPELDPSVMIDPEVSGRWVREAAAAYGGDKADHARLVEIVGRIRQRSAFATLDLDGRRVAWGLGVYERGFVGLYDIVVEPELRGLGLGRRMVEGLLTWGREQGAGHAYLQVREENRVALDLYGSLGFAQGYRYTHRVMGAPPGDAR